MDNQRYQTDGILRHFEYDAIITGSSMAECFSASQFDELFGTQSVKVPLSGSYLKETADAVDRALDSRTGVRYVVRTLDIWALQEDKDYMSEIFEYPEYLYDDSLLNDVNYVLNLSVLFKANVRVLYYTLSGKTTLDFDTYSNWSGTFQYGAEEIKKRYTRPEKSEKIILATEEDILRVTENIQQNVVSLAEKYPDTEFYYFIPPWSIYLFDSWDREGKLLAMTEMLETAVGEMIGCENIHVFSFLDAYDVVCDPNNHKDEEHYGEWVNAYILECMKTGEHRLTPEDYKSHFQEIEAFYSQYPYESLF